MTPEQNKKLVEDMAIIVFGKFVIEEDFINLQAALDVAKVAIRNDALECVLQKILLITPTMPHDGPSSKEHDALNDSLHVIFHTVKAMKLLKETKC